MIKAALRLSGLVFLLVATLSATAQTVPADANIASEEAVRRAADTMQLRKKLVLAQAAQERKDYPLAAKLYEDCYTLVQRIGPATIQPEAQQTVAGLTNVLLELAHQAQARHDYATADERIKRVLIIDPQNRVALAMAKDNKRLMALQAGTVPSPEVMAEVPGFRTNEVRVATLVQDGKLLFEAGKLDAAEAKLEQAYKEDPQNAAAYYYLNLIKEKRTGQAIRRSELESKDAILQVEKQWDISLQKQQLQLPNSYARSNAVYTGRGRQMIMSKLDRIRVDSIKYDGLPLAEVINNLSEIAKTRDPDRTGINFFINREAPAAAPVAATAGAIDPTTGLPVAGAALPTEPVDVGAVTVKIAPALTDVRLADVLDAITKTSDKPIRYSIEDYAVVFALKGPETIPLFTRIYHIDPNTFRQGLEAVGGIAFGNVSTGSQGGGGGGGGGSSGGQNDVVTVVPRVNVVFGSVTGGQGTGGTGGQQGANGIRNVTRTNLYEDVQIAARNFFTAAGVDFNPANPANVGKSLFFNDRKGILMVHASSQELDIIEKAIQILNVAPPQINIKSKFVEITQNDTKALGFDWFLGNFLMGGGKVGAQGGTAPSFNGVPTTANPSGIFPGSPATVDPVTGLGSLPTTIPPASTDQLITSGLRNTAGSQNVSTIATVTGLLTDPQFRVAIKALEQRDGVDLLTAPDVTTESGRQAQIQAVDIQTIVTGQNFGQGANGATGAGGNNTVINNTATTLQYLSSTLPFGPVLDVIPYVSADEFSVQMTIIPTVTEFVGYDDPGGFVPRASAIAGGTSLVGQLPLPHFRMRQVTTSVTVWDAQTVVLGGLITDSVTKLKDKVPLLGDMPFVGRLFRSESSAKTKKNLVVFVTPTIINPDGSRYHSDEEMPFAANSFPPQRPVTQ
jgi:type II secretory pathway component GspD/PulD (secretin)